MDEYPIYWELVSQDTTYELTTVRLRVPGGYLVHILDSSNETTNVTFVQSPDHGWNLES